MTFFNIFGAFTFLLLAFCTVTVHSKSILAVAISSRGDKISLDSTDASISKLESIKASSETIRKGSKQDNDEDEATTQTNEGTPSPLQMVVSSVFAPGVEYAAVSILKAISSPFEFLTKSVSDYVNPISSTAKPTKQVAATNNVVDSSPSLSNEQSQVTYVVVSPDQNVPAPESPPKSTSPPRQQTTVSNEEDEEDDEEIEDDLF